MTHEPVSRPMNLGEGVRSSGRAPAPVPPPLDAEVRAIFATLPAPATDAALKGWLEGLIRTPTRPAARALAYLAEQVRAQPGSETLAAAVAQMAAEIHSAVERQEAIEGFASALNEALRSVLELGRGIGRQDVEAELAAAPVLERQTKFIADEKGRIIGKTETEFRGRARA